MFVRSILRPISFSLRQHWFLNFCCHAGILLQCQLGIDRSWLTPWESLPGNPPCMLLRKIETSEDRRKYISDELFLHVITNKTNVHNFLDAISCLNWPFSSSVYMTYRQDLEYADCIHCRECKIPPSGVQGITLNCI